jgi:metal-dependent hydrolase (beta-lactamase superfamily II)
METMQVIQTKISDIDALIQIPDEKIKIVNAQPEQYQAPMGKTNNAEQTAKDLEKAAKEVLENASNLIFGIADNFKQQSKANDNTPDEIEVEFSLLIGADAKIVVVSGKAETSIKVRMKWNKAQ